MTTSKALQVDHIRIDQLNDIAVRILGNQDLAVTCETILETLKTQTDAHAGTILFYDEIKENLNPYAWTKTTKITSALKIVEGNIFKFKFSLSHKELLVTKCINENRIFTSPNLRDFFCPALPRKVIDLIQKILGTKISIVLPILVDKKPYGVLLFTFTKFEKLSEKQLSILKFYTNLSSLAIDNSLKYEGLEKRFEIEKTTTSMLSHELKTPIAVSYNSIQYLKFFLDKNKDKLGNMEKELTEIYGDVSMSVKRMNDICNSIFSLRESDAPSMSAVHKLDLEKQLAQVLDNYERKSTDKGVTFNKSINIAKGQFFGGGVQFEQVMTILLDNALKYTNSGTIDLNVELSDQSMKCTVTDTGCGIPDSKKKDVFERFYRHRSIKNKYLHKIKGLGLGLHIAQKLVDRLGGNIKVEDNPDSQGTSFTVEIPVYKKLPTQKI
ncbi:ATP-binding protein [Pseudomonadota bacterium]